MAVAGKILIMPKGEWDSSASYKILDLVTHNNVAWLAKKTVTGIEPGEETEEYWFKFVDVAAIQDEKVAELEAVITTLKDDVAGVQENLGELKLSYVDGTYYAQYGEDEATKKALGEGEIRKDLLLEALAYSGLGLTQDSTAEEIYSALRAAFPSLAYVFRNGTLADGVEYENFTSADGYMCASAEADSGEDPPYESSREARISFDFTGYHYLDITLKYNTYANYGSSSAAYGIDAYNSTGLPGTENSEEETTIKIDISSYTGVHFVGFNLYACNDSSAAGWTAFSKIWISEMKLYN